MNNLIKDSVEMKTQPAVSVIPLGTGSLMFHASRYGGDVKNYRKIKLILSFFFLSFIHSSSKVMTWHVACVGAADTRAKAYRNFSTKLLDLIS